MDRKLLEFFVLIIFYLGITVVTKTDANVIRTSKENNIFLWPDATIYYSYDSSFGCPDSEECTNFHKAIEEYSKKTCLKFQKTSQPRDNYFVLQNNSRKKKACRTPLGYKGGKAVLNLGQCYKKPGYYLHLLGHVVGLENTLNAPDRDQLFEIYWDNVIDNDYRFFDKLKMLGYQSKFDPDSAMNVPLIWHSKNGKPVYGTKNGDKFTTFFDMTTISNGDANLINNLYKCKK